MYGPETVSRILAPIRSFNAASLPPIAQCPAKFSQKGQACPREPGQSTSPCSMPKKAGITQPDPNFVPPISHSLTSGGYRVRLLFIAAFSQVLEPPVFPERFSGPQSPLVCAALARTWTESASTDVCLVNNQNGDWGRSSHRVKTHRESERMLRGMQLPEDGETDIYVQLTGAAKW